MFSTANGATAAASSTCDPPRPISLSAESSSAHDACVSLDARDTLSDVSSSLVVGDTAISSSLLIPTPHDKPKDIDETPASSRGDPSVTIADVCPPQKDPAEAIISREGIVDSPLGGLNDVVPSVASTNDLSIDYLSEKMQALPLPVDALALFDALNPDVDTLLHDDLGDPPGYLSDDQGIEDPIAAQQPLALPSFIATNSMVASKVASARASFNPSGGLISWRGFQISSSSRESLERLLARFPQILDQLIIKASSAQTFFLDQLAGLIIGLHTLSLYSLRAEDLKKFSDDVDDLAAMGVDMSPFRARLDLLKSNFNLVGLRSEVAIRNCEDDSFSAQILEFDEAANKLKIHSQDLKSQLQEVERQLQDLESATRDVKESKAENLKIRDAAITDLEALSMPSLQFDMSWPLDHDLL